MPLLKSPNEIIRPAQFSGLFYGRTGLGKSTVALSAPNPVMIDTDHGMHRVEKAFQAPSLQVSNHKDLIDLVESNELDPFDTVVIDTIARSVARVIDYVAASSSANRQKDGTISQRGFGKVKTEFDRLVRLFKDRNKSLVFVAHEKEKQDGDTNVMRPDLGQGASGQELIKDLDFIAYVEMVGDERIAHFRPTDRFFAKNPWGLSSIVIPDTNKYGNIFIKKFILPAILERQKRDDEENQRYTDLLAAFAALVGTVDDAASANEAYEQMRKPDPIWDSRRIGWDQLLARAEGIGLVFDRRARQFVGTKTDKPSEAVGVAALVTVGTAE